LGAAPDLAAFRAADLTEEGTLRRFAMP